MPLLGGSLSPLTQNQKQVLKRVEHQALKIINPEIGRSEAINTYTMLPAKQFTVKQSHSVMNKIYAAAFNH